MGQRDEDDLGSRGVGGRETFVPGCFLLIAQIHLNAMTSNTVQKLLSW